MFLLDFLVSVWPSLQESETWVVYYLCGRTDMPKTATLPFLMLVDWTAIAYNIYSREMLSIESV